MAFKLRLWRISSQREIVHGDPLIFNGSTANGRLWQAEIKFVSGQDGFGERELSELKEISEELIDM